MKKIFSHGLALSLFLLSSVSYADFLFEPHLGYNLKGSADYTGTVRAINPIDGSVITDSVVAKDKYNGLQFGLRLGGEFSSGLMLGFDYNRSNYTVKTSYPDGSPSVKDKYGRDEFGAFAGWNFPIPLRAWFGYYILNQEISEDNANSGSKKGDSNEGNSWELGLGYKILPTISLNLLYREMRYDEGTASGIAYTLSPVYKAHEIVLGISAPLKF